MWAFPSDAVQLWMLNGGKRGKKTMCGAVGGLAKTGISIQTLFIADCTLCWRYSGCHCVVWGFFIKNIPSGWMSGVHSASRQVPGALKYCSCVAESVTSCWVFLRNVFDCCGRLKAAAFALGRGAGCPVCSRSWAFPSIPTRRASS